MLDLLNLPGVEPADLRCEEGVITVVANAVDGSPPKCPECARPMYRHGKRTSIFADTPLQMQPTRLEIVRPSDPMDGAMRQADFRGQLARTPMAQARAERPQGSRHDLSPLARRDHRGRPD